jgi:hypothetical protein
MGESVQMQTEEQLKQKDLDKANAEILALKKQLLMCQRAYLQAQADLLGFQNEKLTQLEQTLAAEEAK